MIKFSGKNINDMCELKEEFFNRFNIFVEKSLDGIRKNRKYNLVCTYNDIENIEILSGAKRPHKLGLRSDRKTCGYLVGRLLKQFRRFRNANPDWESYHVTILDDRWMVSDTQTSLPITEIEESCRGVLAAMADNYIAVVEMQAFSNIYHQLGGNALSLHVHAIVFGEDIRPRMMDAMKGFTPQFRATIMDRPPIVADRIAATDLDLARVIRYPWKGHDRCKNRYKAKDGREDLNESEAPDRYIRYFRVFQILSLMPVKRIIFAGGDQANVMRARALRDLRRWLKKRSQQQTLLNTREAIFDFWDELVNRMREPRFQRPIFVSEKK